MNKIKLNVVKEEKIDNRVNNTGRPVNKKSSRQIRLAKQALYNKLHTQFINGRSFKINNDAYGVYVYTRDLSNVKDNGSIICGVTGHHVCNLNYVGRTKATGYTFVMGRKLNITVNLKNVEFVK